MSSYLSKKIKYLNFVAAVAVVIIHAYNYNDSYLLVDTTISEGNNPGALLEYFLSNGIARFAVPVFFIISGYLFFRNYENTVKGYLIKLKKRFFSIVIPFIFWVCVSGVMIYFCATQLNLGYLNIVSNHMQTINTNPLLLFISPAAFQLWYLQELIFLFILSPLVYFLLKKFNIFPIFAFAVLWIMNITVNIAGINLNFEAFLFFFVGAYLAIHKKEYFMELKVPKKSYFIAVFVAWIIINAAKTFWAAGEGAIVNEIGLLVLYKLSVLLGIFVAWYGMDYLMKPFENTKATDAICKSTFMIFVIQEPLQHIIYQYLIVQEQSEDWYHIFIYFMVAIGIVLLGIILNTLINKFMWPLQKAITGNR